MLIKYHLITAQLQQKYALLKEGWDVYLKRIGSYVVIVASFILLLTSCITKRSAYEVPAYQLPEQFKNQLVQEDFAVNPAPTPELPLENTPVDAKPSSFSINEWWLLFNSDELSGLIDRGMANNPDIRIASIHISQAKNYADQVHGGQFPTLDTSFSLGPQHGSTPTSNFSGASLNGAWKIDLWGEQASLAQEADFQLWLAVFDANNAKRNTAASIANSYVEYLLSNERLKIARETEKILSGLLVTMEKRAKSGDATLFELEQQRSAIYSERSLIPNLEQQREEAIEFLAYLLGTVPEAIKLSETDLDSLHMPGKLPDLPSALLLRRPDVRSAEARLLASDAEIDVMRARILPSVNLTTQTGYSGLLSQLFKPETFFWNMFANITTNIFDAGKQSLDIKQSKLYHEEMMETYGRTILQAVREVEHSLYSVRVSSQRTKLQNEAMSSAQKAWDISNKIYAVGGVDFMSLQDTQRTYRRYTEDFQHIRADYFHAYIGLFQALGGGEDMDTPLPGKGTRPKAVTLTAQSAESHVTSSAPRNTENSQQVQWKPGQDDNAEKREYWQVILPGHYQRKTIGSVLRDLQHRFPQQMEQKKLYPTLDIQVGEAKDIEATWYSLKVAKFGSVEQAQNFCQSLQVDLQQCSIISNRSDQPIANVIKPKQVEAQAHLMLPEKISMDTSVAETMTEKVDLSPKLSVTSETVTPINSDPRNKIDVAEPMAAISEQAPLDPHESEPTRGKTVEQVPTALSEAPLSEAPIGAAPISEAPLGERHWKIQFEPTYERKQIATVLRDLQLRFPQQMEQKNIIATLDSQHREARNKQLPRFRLSIANFDNSIAAVDFCKTVQSENQRCQVVSSPADAPNVEEMLVNKK